MYLDYYVINKSHLTKNTTSCNRKQQNPEYKKLNRKTSFVFNLFHKNNRMTILKLPYNELEQRNKHRSPASSVDHALCHVTIANMFV